MPAHSEDSDRSESSLGAHSFCWFCHEAAQIFCELRYLFDVETKSLYIRLVYLHVCMGMPVWTHFRSSGATSRWWFHCHRGGLLVGAWETRISEVRRIRTRSSSGAPGTSGTSAQRVRACRKWRSGSFYGMWLKVGASLMQKDRSIVRIWVRLIILQHGLMLG